MKKVLTTAVISMILAISLGTGTAAADNDFVTSANISKQSNAIEIDAPSALEGLELRLHSMVVESVSTLPVNETYYCQAILRKKREVKRTWLFVMSDQTKKELMCDMLIAAVGSGLLIDLDVKEANQTTDGSYEVVADHITYRRPRVRITSSSTDGEDPVSAPDVSATDRDND